jgi:hypothetical protein
MHSNPGSRQYHPWRMAASETRGVVGVYGGMVNEGLQAVETGLWAWICTAKNV